MTEEKIKKRPSRESDEDLSDKRILILHNDDVHTFDFVIDSLMEICRHEYYQASQCASITHNNGKCDIKTGYFDELKKMKDELTSRELTVTIE
jgi:ATP-dependent Clp protease adaptor protein ClpS